MTSSVRRGNATIYNNLLERNRKFTLLVFRSKYVLALIKIKLNNQTFNAPARYLHENQAGRWRCQHHHVTGRRPVVVETDGPPKIYI